tara:strand:+ start:274 stop:453 length:180 start_codon:yes stop_codon:yes gene_type:complete
MVSSIPKELSIDYNSVTVSSKKLLSTSIKTSPLSAVPNQITKNTMKTPLKKQEFALNLI